MTVAARDEEQFGTVKDLDSTYTLLGEVPTGHRWNVYLQAVNLLDTVVKIRAFIADNSWSSAEPSGSTKVVAIAYDTDVGSEGGIFFESGIVMLAGQKLVVWSDTTNGLDVIACGMDLTLE